MFNRIYDCYNRVYRTKKVAIARWIQIVRGFPLAEVSMFLETYKDIWVAHKNLHIIYISILGYLRNSFERVLH